MSHIFLSCREVVVVGRGVATRERERRERERECVQGARGGGGWLGREKVKGYIKVSP